jgi:hypothetical protein
VKIPEALHGFNFIEKDQRRKILPLRFHHHQLLIVNVLTTIFINDSRIWGPYSNKIMVCQYIFDEA